MPKKTCPNGHVYDTAIYGDQCPMCPSQGAVSSETSYNSTQVESSFSNNMMGAGHPADNHTHIANPTSPTVGFPNVGGFQAGSGFQPQAGFNGGMGQNAQDNSGETRVRPNDALAGVQTAKTTIRRPGQNGAQSEARRLVGFLVTYNRDPMGKAYNIYEGRNYVGRDSKCNICIPDDSQMSGTHMSILFRSVDSKFKFRDEQSSNGTFVNKQLLDEGELKNYDIIRVGNTLFIFMAIPILN